VNQGNDLFSYRGEDREEGMVINFLLFVFHNEKGEVADV